IDLPATNGRIATYTFNSTGTTVLPTPGGANPPVIGVGGEPVILLQSILLPPGNGGSRAKYSMVDGQTPAYYEYGQLSPGDLWSGALRKLTLPTQGSISWEYD